MKKYILLVVIGTLIISGFGAGGINLEKESNTKTIDTENLDGAKDYTHTVFVEWGSAQFCGPCAGWSSNIWNVYNSGQYDFEYVTMIVYGHGGWSDILNIKARSWKNLYGFTSYPTNIMDGDYRRQGSSSGTFPGNLNACGNRAVHDLDGTLTVTWQGNAVLDIDIEIENNEGSSYSGYIRVPISEIVSRYTNAYGQKYHFGFLDYPFPMNKAITIPAGGIYTDSVTWDGSQHKDNHGDYFDDIDHENIQVFLGVYNNANGYLDETVAAGENNPPEIPEIDGTTSGNAGTAYDYDFAAIDPDGDDIAEYIVNWGDGPDEAITGPFASGSPATASHTWTSGGDFTITARAKDVNGLTGPTGTLEVTMPRNKAVNTPFLNFLENHPILYQLLQRLLQL